MKPSRPNSGIEDVRMLGEEADRETQMVKVDVLRGPKEITPVIDEIARLRISVFRDWPYLYAGTMEEEAKYLAHFAQSEHACVGLARDGDKVVGATTAEPMPSTHEEFRAPFESSGIDISAIFYFCMLNYVSYCFGIKPVI